MKIPSEIKIIQQFCEVVTNLENENKTYITQIKHQDTTKEKLTNAILEQDEENKKLKLEIQRVDEEIKNLKLEHLKIDEQKKNKIEYNHAYAEKNSEKLKIQKAETYKKNKEEINKQKSQKIMCECGALIRKDGKSKHVESYKHKRLVSTTPSHMIIE